MARYHIDGGYCLEPEQLINIFDQKSIQARKQKPNVINVTEDLLHFIYSEDLHG